MLTLVTDATRGCSSLAIVDLKQDDADKAARELVTEFGEGSLSSDLGPWRVHEAMVE